MSFIKKFSSKFQNNILPFSSVEIKNDRFLKKIDFKIADLFPFNFLSKIFFLTSYIKTQPSEVPATSILACGENNKEYTNFFSLSSFSYSFKTVEIP